MDLPYKRKDMQNTASNIHFFLRSYDNTPTNHALGVSEGLFFADAVVPEICVPDPEGIPVPVVTEGFQVPVVVML